MRISDWSSDVCSSDLFEGEPARLLEARRAKTSPLRDVAGMLRSLDYVAAMALRDDGASSEGERVTRRQIIERFREVSTSAFQSAYATATTGIDHQWQATNGADALIDLFSIEKRSEEHTS